MSLMIVMMIIAGVLLAAIFLQNRIAKTETREIDKTFPIWKIENGIIINKNGDISAVLQVELPEIFSLSNSEYEALHHGWLKAIKVLPPGAVLHKQDWFLEAKYTPAFTDNADDFLRRSSDRFFNERPFLDHSCYLTVTLPAKGRRPATSAYCNLLRKSIAPPETTGEHAGELLIDCIGQFSRILSDSTTIRLRLLCEEELTGTKDRQGILERYLLLASEEKFQLSDIVFKPEWKIGSNHCVLYTLADADYLPSTCSPRIHYEKYSTDKTRFAVGFAGPIGQLLPVNHIYNQYMVVGDIPKTLKRMEAKRRRLQSLSAYSRENAISRDATAQFLNEAIAEARTPVKAHFNLLCWTDDLRQLKEVRNKAASALSQMEAVPHQETISAPQLYWAALPGNGADLPDNESFDTFAEQACCFFNMETAYRSSKSPFGLRLGDRLNGVPVHVDISDEPMGKVTTNRNKLCVGGSGSGKSMFMNHLVHSYIQQGSHCVIVDVGHSYEGLCDLVGGYYFTYSEDNPIRFNPFYIPPGEVLDTEKKESIKTLLVALWKQNEESFRRSEYVAISNAIQSYYQYLDQHREIFPCFNSFYEFLQEHFTKELESDGVQDRHFDMHNFLYVLRPFYKNGEFDYLLNATEHLDLLQQPFIVFELDNIKDHAILFPVVTLVIMELFVSKMRKLKGMRKVIVIEEAWKAIARQGMAEFMKYLYKTVRKHFGEAITVTQEIDDIISSPVIKEAIINNADCKILLDMKKFQNKFDTIQAVMGMSDKGRELVLSLNRANDATKKYREVYIELGNQLMKVYRYEPSVEEYYAYSTEQKDKLKVKEYTEKYGGDIRKALRVLALEETNKRNVAA